MILSRFLRRSLAVAWIAIFPTFAHAQSATPRAPKGGLPKPSVRRPKPAPRPMSPAQMTEALCDAIINKKTSAALDLIRRGASVTAKNNLGGTPLQVAAGMGNEVVFRALLDKGAPAKSDDEDDDTLTRAVESESLPIRRR